MPNNDSAPLLYIDVDFLTMNEHSKTLQVMKMDVGQLRYFSKIVEHRSFTRAAEDCLVSQPALSQQIGKLERELGQPLFERQGRTIRLTPAGQLLHDKAEQILFLVEDAKRRITDDGETGQICIGAVPTVAPYMLPVVLRKVGDQFPKASMVVSEDSSEKLMKRVSNGEVDLGFLTAPAKSKYLQVETLFEEPLCLAVPANHRLAEKDAISLEDVSEEPFVFLGDTHCLTDSIASFCNGNSFQPIGTTRIEQLITVQNLVAMGHGLSFVPAMATRQNVDGRIVYRKVAGEQPTRTIAVCWTPYRFQGQLQKNFIKSVREFCEGYDFASDLNEVAVK